MASKYKFNFDSVKETIKTEGEKKGFEKDKRFWVQEKKKENTVVIRFLPDAEGNPYVKVYNHSFSYTQGGKTKWWIENCINTFGYDRECPICEKNQIYYKSAFKSDNEISAQRGRKLNYISNILVVKNPNNPDDDGKVFLMKYGKKVFEKIKSRMYPSEVDLQDEDFKTFVPFDLFEGANFKLKTTMQGEANKTQYPNYDTSEFANQSKLAGGDEGELDRIMGMTYLLSEFIQEDKFPTNEKTIKILGGLLGVAGFEEDKEETDPSSNSLFEEGDVQEATPDPTTPVDDLPFELDETTPSTEATPTKSSSDDDDDEDFFGEFATK